MRDGSNKYLFVVCNSEYSKSRIEQNRAERRANTFTHSKHKTQMRMQDLFKVQAISRALFESFAILLHPSTVQA